MLKSIAPIITQRSRLTIWSLVNLMNGIIYRWLEILTKAPAHYFWLRYQSTVCFSPSSKFTKGL